ncbi:excinuclease ABC subunit UvrC [Treponema phagedenis]|uniref:UvrABC system protein C n=2 Tax=Treponema phagedenis TaxID=162 RepID=A0A0B7GXD2_TREPH|nr:excinuclease ABC subunit UvrC [Treponema phagedenis]EFW36377.1 excinuclease ABC, C subunit [Treponema phagedenis F0421]CEM61585.1 UvrABC system protein C [Treponema phagedenis]
MMKSQSEETRKKLHEIALKAPKSSGVYLWADAGGVIIYVGKAKSLKNRLSSYFTSKKDIKTRILVSRAAGLEYIQTKNEYEALLLENTLIKKHKPRYNINLKDGKTYPVLKLTNEQFPRLYRTRNIHNDGAQYFGPFPNVAAVDQFLDLVKRNYKLRQCKTLKKRAQPCLYYHIGRCDAPCCGLGSREEYHKEVEEIALLLDGDADTAVKKLTEKMKEAAAQKEFERAARIRDGIQAVYAIRGQNIVEDMDPEGRDYIAWASEAAMVTFAVLRMRGGRLVGRDLYRTQSLKDEEEILSEFLIAYYTKAELIPPHIFVPSESGHELAEKWFKEEFNVETKITMIPLEKSEEKSFEESSRAAAIPEPKEKSFLSVSLANTCANSEVAEPENMYAGNSFGLPNSVLAHHRAALAMAKFNAGEDAARRLREAGDYPALEELQKILSLPNIPHRIEGFDIAHLYGKYTVASLISFKDGNPDKKNYRIFRLKNTDGVIDDFESMREAVARRYTRLINEKADLPDLILIDGGIGQVNAAKGILDALEADIPIVGLAEKDEELFLPHTSKPIVLPKRSVALRMLQRVRDETHRFATTRNRHLRSKEELKLRFENLPHIGKKRAAMLLKQFGSIEAVGKNSAETIAAAAKISLQQASEVLEKITKELS